MSAAITATTIDRSTLLARYPPELGGHHLWPKAGILLWGTVYRLHGLSILQVVGKMLSFASMRTSDFQP